MNDIPVPTAIIAGPLTIRITPETNGYRWHLRTDYSTNDRSGWGATRREALVAATVAAAVGQ